MIIAILPPGRLNYFCTSGSVNWLCSCPTNATPEEQANCDDHGRHRRFIVIDEASRLPRGALDISVEIPYTTVQPRFRRRGPVPEGLRQRWPGDRRRGR